MSQQRGRVALGAVLGSTWMVGLALPPYLLSRAVDGLAGGRRDVVLWWAAALVLVGAVLAWLSIWRHRTMTRVRMDAAYRTVLEVNAHAVRLGATLAQRTRTGEVVAIGGGDAWTIGRSLTVTGPGVGAALAYAVIAVLLLRISVLLAVVVLVGVPILALIVGPALGSAAEGRNAVSRAAGPADGSDRRHHRGVERAERVGRQGGLRRPVPG